MNLHIAPLRSTADIPSDQNEIIIALLNLWISLPDDRRKDEFASTASAAKIAGVAQRTIQNWIEFGNIVAVPIGRKHKVHLVSLRKYLVVRAKH